jgi:hypothetical protein
MYNRKPDTNVAAALISPSLSEQVFDITQQP